MKRHSQGTALWTFIIPMSGRKTIRTQLWHQDININFLSVSGLKSWVFNSKNQLSYLTHQQMHLSLLFSEWSLVLFEHSIFRFRGFRLMQLCFNSCLLFYSNYPLHVSVVRSSFWLKMVVQPKHIADNLNN
jgi:hypothetical protein